MSLRSCYKLLHCLVARLLCYCLSLNLYSRQTINNQMAEAMPAPSTYGCICGIKCHVWLKKKKKVV